MADDQGRAVAVGRSLECNSSAELVMENILDKLKLLNYERNFLRLKKTVRPPLTRTYFAFPNSAGAEQFFYFTGLVAWLFTVVGRTTFKAPGPSDDPNTVCTDILTELKACGFALPAWAPAKLKTGYGEPVCGVLDNLLDYVLESRGFRFQAAVMPKDEAGEVEEVEGDMEEDGRDDDGFEGGGAHDDDDSSDGGEDYGGAVHPVATSAMPAAREERRAPELSTSMIIESRIDADEWRAELDRVTPLLKIPVAADARDWRSHLDQVRSNMQEVRKHMPSTQTHLEGLRAQAESMEEKLANRERSLNQQFDALISQYRDLKRQLTEVQGVYNAKTDEVSRLQDELGRVRELLEDTKTRLEEHGSSISDASPLMKINNAIKQLEGEVKGMEIRIGILANTVLKFQVVRVQ